MALVQQRRKRKLEIQPTKIRLRLVQVGACVQPPNGTLTAGSQTLTGLSYLPAWLEPGSQIQIGPAGSTAEVVAVTSINTETNSISFGPTASSHSGLLYITPADFGRYVVLGRVFWASRLGLNGITSQGRGFSEGKYERLLNNEGPCSIEVPNAVGTDGILHRERFLITAEGVSYRPGDEWIEIWRSSGDFAAGQLLYVGTPTGFTISEDTVSLDGFDALWTLRKQREGTAGWFVNAPADVFGQFTKAAVSVIADDFTVPSRFPAGSGYLTSGDGRWKYSNAEASPVSSNVRLKLSPGAEIAAIMSEASFPMGTTSANAHNRWRVETTLTVPALAGGANFALGVSVGPITSIGAVASTGINVLEGLSQNVAIGVNSLTPTETVTVQQVTTNGTEGITAGSHSMAIEGRDRWLYFYLDGVLIFSYQMPEANLKVKPFVIFESPHPVSSYVDVDYVLCRVWEPYLSHGFVSPTLPGKPSQGGLQGVYFNDNDLYAAFPTDVGKRQLNPATRGGLASSSGGVSQVFAERIDPTLAFGNGTAWEPPGLPAHEKFSVRWTGAIYLSSAFTFKLYVAAKGGFRIWIGKTLVGEEVASKWVNGTPTNEPRTANPFFPPNLGDGWFPIIIEYQAGVLNNWTPTFRLYSIVGEAERGIQVPVNAGPYSSVILAQTSPPRYYWPLNNVERETGATQFFGSPSTWKWEIAAIAKTSPITNIAGPIYNDQALYLAPTGGLATGYPRFATGAGTAGTAGMTAYTMEVWINPASIATTWQEIVYKQFVYELSLKGSTLCVEVGNGTEWKVKLEAGTITAGAWTHVAFSYDGKHIKLYVNGVKVGESAEVTGGFGAGTEEHFAAIGYAPGSEKPYTGGIGHLAFYERAVTEAQLQEHITKGTSSVLLSNGEAALSNIPLSPQGIFEQLVRNDSHQAQLLQLIENFGYQATCEPRSLESGQFPGQLIPHTRQGHDTDYVLDHDNTLNPSVQGQADDVADIELVDAQGLADPSNQAQLYGEIFDFEEISEQGHLLISTEYDSPGDIQTAQQLVQRGSSLLALRKNPWTVITGSTAGHIELTDTFPVTGSNWSEFAWLPGDGIRYHLPLLNIEDKSTRQLYDIAWQFFPDGLVSPTIAVLERPKTVRDTLRKIQKESLDESRNYQGQLVTVSGTNGAGTANGTETPVATGAGASDVFTRVSLPTNLTAVKSVTLVVQVYAPGNSEWEIDVINVNTGIKVTSTGRFDVTAWLRRETINNGPSRLWAYLRNANKGTTGSYEINLEILLKV